MAGYYSQDMLTALELSRRGWQRVIVRDDFSVIQEQISWCYGSFGRRYGDRDPETFCIEGEWFGARLTFTTGTETVLMFPPANYSLYRLRWG